MSLQLVHIADKGSVRETNQDSFCVHIAGFNEKLASLLVVCDGMGGLQCGEVASTCAIKGFEKWFETDLPQLLCGEISEQLVFDSWEKLLLELHNDLAGYAQERGVQLGTTVSALLLLGDMGYIAQIGDSRIYLDDTENIVQLTEDQTVAMREYKAGKITWEDMKLDERGSVLLQCLGTGNFVPAFSCFRLPHDGAVLLCSDGFYHEASSEMLHKLLNEGNDRAQIRQNLEALVRFCRENGESDNITALALRWTADNAIDFPHNHNNELDWFAKVSGAAISELDMQRIGGFPWMK